MAGEDADWVQAAQNRQLAKIVAQSELERKAGCYDDLLAALKVAEKDLLSAAATALKHDDEEAHLFYQGRANLARAAIARAKGVE